MYANLANKREERPARRWELWLVLMHTLCFCIHAPFATLSFYLGSGKDMNVDIYRVKPDWNKTGTNGYDFEVVPHRELRIDTVTGTFFLLSALFHFVWAVSGWCLPRVWKWMLVFVEDCFCFWRFIEYSLSASLMLMAIGMITGLRDYNSMLGVFMLSFTTMMLGIITELLSRPAGPDRWQGDPEIGDNAFASRFSNYARRMFPHFVGWFPYSAAWYIVLNNFFLQIDDLTEDVRERIPWFVSWSVYGTAVTFTSFAFVQIYFQWVPPKRYWKTELWYCALSASAKLCELLPGHDATRTLSCTIH